MTAPLYIVRLVLDRREVLRVGARHHLGPTPDDGSLLHAALSQLFAHSDERAEVPLHNFAVDDVFAATQDDPTRFFVLAYSDHDEHALRGEMGRAQHDLLRECRTNPVKDFEHGQRIGFRTRVCPIVRTRSAGDHPRANDHRGKPKHRELDVFLHATLAVGPEEHVDRGGVYARWLQHELRRDSAADCETSEVRLTGFKRQRLRRKGREGMERPDAILEGALMVNDPRAFRALLVRGIGRHRAFGFGMLLLRALPAR